MVIDTILIYRPPDRKSALLLAGSARIDYHWVKEDSMNIRYRLALVVLAAPLLSGCFLFPNDPFVPSTIASLGDSITMGIQDAGLVADNQYHCYPYLVAMQMGQARGFVQPLVGSPGIGVPPYETPLRLEAGFVKTDYLPEGITQEQLMQLIVPKLQNLFYPDPYNNLGVNGARLDDLNHAKGYANSYGGENFFYDIVLRNLDPPWPNIGEGKNAVEQAVLLDPEYILLWIGNNDILGYVLSGGEKPDRITDATTFENELRTVSKYLQDNTTAKIVLANIPEYLPFGYALDDVFDENDVPRLFDPRTLKKINFGDGGSPEYKTLHVIDDPADGAVEHILLTGAADYIEKGTGIDPGELDDVDKALLLSCGVHVPDKAEPLRNDLVFTHEEWKLTLDTIHQFNDIIATVAADPDVDVPVVDVNRWMQPGGGPPLPDDSCLGFALVSPHNTIFSLDGIHPSNYGHALIANEFIATMNAMFVLHIPKLIPENYKDQYWGKALVVPSLKALRRLEEMYAPSR